MAQRACLDHAARLIAALPGPVLELGLGNGRTYDHLRTLLPEREIFVFERALAADLPALPDAAHLVLGDFRDTLPAARARLGARGPRPLRYRLGRRRGERGAGAGDRPASRPPHGARRDRGGGSGDGRMRLDGAAATARHRARPLSPLSRSGAREPHGVKSTITGTWSEGKAQPRASLRMRAPASRSARGGVTQM